MNTKWCIVFELTDTRDQVKHMIDNWVRLPLHKSNDFKQMKSLFTSEHWVQVHKVRSKHCFVFFAVCCFCFLVSMIHLICWFTTRASSPGSCSAHCGSGTQGKVRSKHCSPFLFYGFVFCFLSDLAALMHLDRFCSCQWWDTLALATNTSTLDIESRFLQCILVSRFTRSGHSIV